MKSERKELFQLRIVKLLGKDVLLWWCELMSCEFFSEEIENLVSGSNTFNVGKEHVSKPLKSESFSWPPENHA